MTLADLRFSRRSSTDLAHGAAAGRRHRLHARARDRRGARPRRAGAPRCRPTCPPGRRTRRRRVSRRRFSIAASTRSASTTASASCRRSRTRSSAEVARPRCPGCWCATIGGAFTRTAATPTRSRSTTVPLPARQLVERLAPQYACLLHRPAYLDRDRARLPVPLLVLLGLAAVRSLVPRAIDRRRLRRLRDHRRSRLRGRRSLLEPPVTEPRARDGAARSAACASGGSSCRAALTRWPAIRSCSRRGGRSPREFDIFFGLEAATDEGLDGLAKDTTVDRTVEAVAVARAVRLRGHRELRDRSRLAGGAISNGSGTSSRGHDLHRAGFTILTPLPGTAYFDEMRAAHAAPWSGRSSTCTTCCGSRRSAPSASSSCIARPGGARS